MGAKVLDGSLTTHNSPVKEVVAVRRLAKAVTESSDDQNPCEGAAMSTVRTHQQRALE